MLFAAFKATAAVLPYRSYAPVLTSPSESVSCIFFDSDGLMYTGTNFGLKAYDGYRFKTYKSDAYTPGILPNNNILSITEDKSGGLWVGTLNGLAKMDKYTGQFRTYFLKGKDQQTIYALYTSRDGTVWIGTDGGLTCYDQKNQTFHTFDHRNTWVIDGRNGSRTRINNYSVKAITEDSNGDILVGTWNNGLMRLRRGKNTFLRYPPMNKLNSAYSLFFDSRHRLWVGSWGNGILRIDNPENFRHPRYHQYPYKTGSFDLFYKILEDRYTGKLWACTREGICSLDMNNPKAEWQQYTQIGDTPLSNCNGLEQDPNGDLWVSTINSGIIQVTFRPVHFKRWQLAATPHGLLISFVWSMLTTDGKTFWLGLNPNGIAMYNRTTDKTLYNRSIPGFESLPPETMTTSVTGICARSNGEIWFATNSYGIIVYRKGQKAKLLSTKNSPFLWENFVNTAFESPDKNMWIGTRSGLSVMFPDGSGRKITMTEGKHNLTKCNIKNIISDKKGNLWLSTDNMGIIRVTGNPRHPHGMRFHAYLRANGKFPISDATACLCDKYGRLWAISNSGGLFLYNAEKDCFEAKNREYRNPGDHILAINEDAYGCLWMLTDEALIRMSIPLNGGKAHVMVFSGEDGLGYMLFATNSTYKYASEMFFGNSNGFFSFKPSSFIGHGEKRHHGKLIISGIYVDDTPITITHPKRHSNMADKLPPYTRMLTIPANVKMLRIDFSLLTYGNTKKNMYTYKLEGYDDDWKYLGNTNTVTFQNLPAGKYRLMVKAKDGEGNETSLPYTLKIKILPPWYASWWAYLAYVLLAMLAAFAGIRWYRERLLTQNRLRMGVLLTNLTHELLTPLTIVSATVFKLRGLAPQHNDEYKVIDYNIGRTTRILRQILEVRKSQAGQLRLKVSRQDIASFVSSEVEAIRPMAEGKKLKLDAKVANREIAAWFDADKLDKILYNLISNAIKYNVEGGSVVVSLATGKDEATITVSDTGIGMSRQQLRHLYTRFFDGDYRRQNITGTGLGLALVHDLVKLHHGHIECQSKEGEGTTFTVRLPIRKNAYDKSEIDTSTVNSAVDRDTIKQLTAEENGGEKTKQETVFVHTKAPAVLIVEDNDDLLELMRQTLSKYYHIFTAKNGKQAWNVILKQKLDLVITDVMMPVMDGFELLRTIKNDKGFWQLPVIILTAKNKDDDQKEGYVDGADAYIMKPFNFEDLIIRANSLIANRRKIMQQHPATEDDPEKENEAVNASDPTQVFLDKAEACVRRHISDAEFDRDAFAREMLVSSSTLYNKLRVLTGKTIVEFVNDIRLEEAHRILQRYPHITITELASRVGFNTPKYFSRLYRNKYPKEGKTE